jgi:hypothetical protein
MDDTLSKSEQSEGPCGPGALVWVVPGSERIGGQCPLYWLLTFFLTMKFSLKFRLHIEWNFKPMFFFEIFISLRNL